MSLGIDERIDMKKAVQRDKREILSRKFRYTKDGTRRESYKMMSKEQGRVKGGIVVLAIRYYPKFIQAKRNMILSFSYVLYPGILKCIFACCMQKGNDEAGR